MFSVIEKASVRLREIEDIKSLNRKIFTMAVELLKAYGEPRTTGVIQKKTVIKHIVTTCKPEVNVEISCSGTDPQETKRINMSVSGEIYSLEITRKEIKGREEFDARKKRNDGAEFPLELTHAHSFFNALAQIKNEIGNKTKNSPKLPNAAI